MHIMTESILQRDNVGFSILCNVFTANMTIYDRFCLIVLMWFDRIWPDMAEIWPSRSNMTIFPFWGYIVLIYPKKEKWSYFALKGGKWVKSVVILRSYLTKYDFFPVIFLGRAENFLEFYGGEGFLKGKMKIIYNICIYKRKRKIRWKNYALFDPSRVEIRGTEFFREFFSRIFFANFFSRIFFANFFRKFFFAKKFFRSGKNSKKSKTGPTVAKKILPNQ